MSNPPVISLPENPTKTQILHAAICADNYSDKLLVEATQWRERAHALFDRADAITKRQRGR